MFIFWEASMALESHVHTSTFSTIIYSKHVLSSSVDYKEHHSECKPANLLIILQNIQLHLVDLRTRWNK